MNTKKEGLNKTCPKCKIQYPATKEYYYGNSSKEDGLAWSCKKCSNASVTKWNKQNPKEGFNIQRKSRLKRLGFTTELFDQMLKSQKNVCALCGTDTPGGPRNEWAADHDHNTGKPRGLLCMSCNTTLGHIEAKNLDWMDKARKYIEQGGFYQPCG
jgi:hypothetical protein